MITREEYDYLANCDLNEGYLSLVYSTNQLMDVDYTNLIKEFVKYDNLIDPSKVQIFDSYASLSGWAARMANSTNTKSFFETKASYNLGCKEIYEVLYLEDSVIGKKYKLVDIPMYFKGTNWLRSYLYSRIEFQKEEYSEHLHFILSFLKYCSYMVMFQGYLCIVRNPIVIKVNKDRALHCEDGPALKFLSSLPEYYWNGQKVTEKIILRQFGIKDIGVEFNAELRRCMIEIYGFENYLKEGNFKLIDKDQVPIRRGFDTMLPRMLIEDSFRNRWFVSSDGSTKRIYFLPTLSSVKTCKQAHEMMCGIPEDKIVAQG